MFFAQFPGLGVTLSCISASPNLIQCINCIQLQWYYNGFYSIVAPQVYLDCQLAILQPAEAQPAVQPGSPHRLISSTFSFSIFSVYNFFNFLLLDLLSLFLVLFTLDPFFFQISGQPNLTKILNTFAFLTFNSNPSCSTVLQMAKFSLLSTPNIRLLVNRNLGLLVAKGGWTVLLRSQTAVSGPSSPFSVLGPFSVFLRGGVVMFPSVEGRVSCRVWVSDAPPLSNSSAPRLSLHPEEEEEENELSSSNTEMRRRRGRK